ncbi:hypothetical protein ACJJIL_11085 [Microbulbifer sp. EKSA005]|uniref:hypothetical protein n=1 Tax=Microbulbifer sp. EKSA005 TaxID=3243364 RepID=UPI0040415395
MAKSSSLPLSPRQYSIMEIRVAIELAIRQRLIFEAVAMMLEVGGIQNVLFCLSIEFALPECD